MLVSAGTAGAVDITGAVEHPGSFSVEDLRKLPAATETVFFHTGKGGVQAVYTGVPLWTLLDKVGLKKTPGVRNEDIRRYLVAKGGDGYYAVIAVGELIPEFGGSQAILAYEQDGKPLDGNAAPVRIIMPNDKGGGRDVLNVISIEVRTADP
jgi:DMSO/TMAO reductase YedYZ molybdopterin-dependent catalytic subunit